MVDLLAELDLDGDEVTETKAPEPEPEPEIPVEEASKQVSILDKLLDDIAPIGAISPYRKILIYGDPGVGKTVFSCGVGTTGFADGVLLIAVEPGALAVKNHEELSNVTVMKYRALAQLKALVEQLKARPEALEKYHTIVIDTMTTLSERHLKSLPLNSVGNADHLKNNDDLKEFARLLTDIEDRNIIILAHVKEEKDESTGRVLVRTQLGPKFGSALNGMVDCVGYMGRTEDEEGNSQFTLQVHPKGNVTAKTRIGGLPTTLINPKITDLITEF